MIRAFLIDTDRGVEVGSLMQYQKTTGYHNEMGISTRDLMINSDPDIRSSSAFLKHKCLIIVDTKATIKRGDWILSDKGRLEKLTCGWSGECNMEIVESALRKKVIKSSHPNHELQTITKPVLYKMIKFYNTFRELPIELEEVIENSTFDVFMKDDELIKRASYTAPYNWEHIGALIPFAKGEEIKKRLGQIMNHKYHLDEYNVGLL